MDNKTTELKVGFISILSAVILILGLSLGNNLSFDQDLVELQIQFPNSGGIRPGDPVMINGLQRGQVSSIENISNGVLISSMLKNIDDLKSDASAKILMFEITGGRKIEIFPGVSDQKLANNMIENGKTSANMSDLIASVGDIAMDAADLIKRLDTISITLGSLINDKKFVGDLKSTASQADSLLAGANEIIYSEKDNIKSTISELRQIASKLNNAIDKNEPEVTEMISKLNGTIDKVNDFLDRTDSAFNGVDEFIKDLNSIVNDIKTNESAINRLMYDKEFATRFDNAITELGKLVAQINEYGINVNARLGTRP